MFLRHRRVRHPTPAGTWLVGLWLCLASAGLLAGPRVIPLDPAHTRLGFQLSTRWGYPLDGIFTRYEGGVTVLPDGRHQVTLRMYTDSVEILEHPRYSDWARSEKFFDAARYPVVVFVSRPYSPQLLREGGELDGELQIRGINRPRQLDVAPSECARPGEACDVVATGAVRRSDYDMDSWKLAVNDRVVFVLRARLGKENSK